MSTMGAILMSFILINELTHVTHSVIDRTMTRLEIAKFASSCYSMEVWITLNLSTVVHFSYYSLSCSIA